jgi:hypothetical protein
MENTILLAKKNMNKFAVQGIVSNGGKFQVGNIIIEFVALNEAFTIVQVYQQGLDAVPVKQTWVKSKKGKTIIKEKIIEKAPEKKEQKILVTDTSEEVLEL